MYLIVKKGEDIAAPGTVTEMFVGDTVAAAAEEWVEEHEADPYHTAPLPDELDIYELKKVAA